MRLFLMCCMLAFTVACAQEKVQDQGSQVLSSDTAEERAGSVAKIHYKRGPPLHIKSSCTWAEKECTFVLALSAHVTLEHVRITTEVSGKKEWWFEHVDDTSKASIKWTFTPFESQKYIKLFIAYEDAGEAKRIVRRIKIEKAIAQKQNKQGHERAQSAEDAPGTKLKLMPATRK